MSLLSNNKLKYLTSLQQKKYREEHGQVLIEGIRLCEEALNSDWIIREIYITDGFTDHCLSDKLLGIAGEKHLSPQNISSRGFQKLSMTKQGQGIILLADIPVFKGFSHDPEWSPQVLLFDDISDPGNLGTLLRAADWFNMHHIIISPHSVEWTNPKVMRASMGAVFHLHIHEQDLFKTLNNLKSNKYTTLASDLHGMPLKQYGENRSVKPWGLVLGNEAHGIKEDYHQLIDQKLTIPGKGDVESLNVAMAGTIMLYELTNIEIA